MSDTQAVRKVAEEYRRKGYDVLVQPHGTSRPSFLRTLDVDLIASKGDEQVVVEVKSAGDLGTDASLAALAAAVDQQPGWRLDVVVAGDQPWPDGLSSDAQEPSKSDVEGYLGEAGRLMSLGMVRAAYMVAWSALEASMRTLAVHRSIPLDDKRPLAVLRSLYSQGLLSPEDYSRINAAMRFRNSVAHGLRTESLPPDLLKVMLDLSRRMLSESMSVASA